MAKERKRRIPDQRSEESKKEKIEGKQNNSQSIKETKKENREGGALTSGKNTKKKGI